MAGPGEPGRKLLLPARAARSIAIAGSQQEVAAFAVEAVATRQTLGDHHLVADIVGMQGQAPVASVIGHHRVGQQGRGRVDGRGAAPLRPDIAQARANAPAAAALGRKAVHEPARCHMA